MLPLIVNYVKSLIILQVVIILNNIKIIRVNGLAF